MLGLTPRDTVNLDLIPPEFRNNHRNSDYGHQIGTLLYFSDSIFLNHFHNFNYQSNQNFLFPQGIGLKMLVIASNSFFKFIRTTFELRR